MGFFNNSLWCLNNFIFHPNIIFHTIMCCVEIDKKKAKYNCCLHMRRICVKKNIFKINRLLVK